jgi:O-antigen ligase
MAILRGSSSIADAVVAPSSLARRGLAIAIDREWMLAPLGSVLLLLHPYPLSVLGGLLGLLPSAARWALRGRPWRATAFDVPLALLVVGAVVGYAVALDTTNAPVRLAGFVAGIVLFAWLRESLVTPRRLLTATAVVLGIVLVGGVALLSIAAPFLRLDLLPPLAVLAASLEPLGLHRPLVDDVAALQRFRLYASGVGALASVGLALVVGLGVAATAWRDRLALLLAGGFFGGLLLVADNRGSLLAAAMTLGVMALAWRPRLFWLVPLFVFGTVDLIGLGLVQRGLDLRTVYERLDFWSNGLALGAETPLTGVGLGVRSVQAAYRTAFQPTYPPFFHVHNIYVQGFLEQGILGLLGLVGVGVATVALGVRIHMLADRRARGVLLAALGGAAALLACGLTEVVALTTVGWSLLCALLAVLAATAEAERRASEASAGQPSRLTSAAYRLRTGLVAGWRSLAGSMRRVPRPVVVGAIVAAVLVVAATGLWRPVAGRVALNVGTSALYRGAPADGLVPVGSESTLATATRALGLAVALDPSSVAARRNLSLAYAAAGDTDAAGLSADQARAITPPGDHRALFGVGRAYLAAGAWSEGIAVWEQAKAGPQLLQLGDNLLERRQPASALAAFEAGKRLAPQDRRFSTGITRARAALGR